MKISQSLYKHADDLTPVEVVLTFNTQDHAVQFKSKYFTSHSMTPLGKSGKYMLVGSFNPQGIVVLEGCDTLISADINSEVTTLSQFFEV